MQLTISDAISAAENELTAEIATFPNQLPDMQPFRYRAASQPKIFESGNRDKAPASRHVIVRSRMSGDVLGTVRILLSTKEQGLTGFSIQRVCGSGMLASLPLTSTGEISRFSLSSDRTGISPAAGALLRLCLLRGLVEISSELGVTHWCALMESALIRLLQASGIHFSPIGPAVQYRGTRQPAVCKIDSMLSRLKLEQPYLWKYITGKSPLGAKSLHQMVH